jgi:ketosteroid isomerase-like protein
MTPEEIYQRYLLASAMTRNADALADLFAVDGVLESPLIPAGHHYPRRLEGREEIRAGMAAFYQRRPPDPGQTVNTARSGYKVHTTADPGVFIVEIDVVLSSPAGTETVSLVQIFRVHDGKIVLMRDYFAPAIVD